MNVDSTACPWVLTVTAHEKITDCCIHFVLLLLGCLALGRTENSFICPPVVAASLHGRQLLRKEEWICSSRTTELSLRTENCMDAFWDTSLGSYGLSPGLPLLKDPPPLLMSTLEAQLLKHEYFDFYPNHC
jgi:hypothetical protein